MRILLINPDGGYHHEYPPLGLLSIAAILRETSHTVHFLDEGVMPSPSREFLEAVAEYAPKYVGLSLYTTNISRAYSIIREIKEVVGDIKIIVGGPHATAMPEATLHECPEIDFLVAGEGEYTFRELIENLESGGNGEEAAGVYLRDPGNRTISFTGERPYLQNLDELPYPAHDLVDFDGYQKNPISLGKRVASVITSRGCPYNCNFCNKAVFKSIIRRRSPEHVVREIKMLVDKFDVDEIYFQDDLFALDRKWLYSFIGCLKNYDLRIPWRMLARVDVLNEKDYVALKEAGCYLVQFGVESGNDAILKNIRKNINVAQVEKAFQDARRAGLETYGFFIFGHRLDTRDTIIETFNLAKRICCDFTSFFLLVPFPGTGVYQYLPDHLKGDWDKIRYINWNKDCDPISLCELSGKELKAFESQVNMEYFGRIQYLVSNVIFTSNVNRLRILKFKWWLRNFVMKWLYICLHNTRIFACQGNQLTPGSQRAITSVKSESK